MTQMLAMTNVIVVTGTERLTSRNGKRRTVSRIGTKWNSIEFKNHSYSGRFPLPVVCFVDNSHFYIEVFCCMSYFSSVLFPASKAIVKYV